MLNLALDSAVLAKTYERVSDRQFNHRQVLLADLALASGQAVLDVGAGTGRLAPYAAELGGRSGKFVAVDLLPLRIELAQLPVEPTGSD